VPAVAASRLVAPDVVLAAPEPAGAGTVWASVDAVSATCADDGCAMNATASADTLAPNRRDEILAMITPATSTSLAVAAYEAGVLTGLFPIKANDNRTLDQRDKQLCLPRQVE
jgi:hypothetical protein